MRVLVLGAGGPAGVNLCRALFEAGHDVLAQDDIREHLVWCEPYLGQSRDGALDVMMAAPDNLTLKLAQRAYATEQVIATFLPKPQTVLLCQDKFECGLAWRRAGLREDRIDLMEAGLTQPHPRWLRARYGAGAKAAIHSRSFHETRLWIGFWHYRDPHIEFIAEDFLPGRDFSWCGIYRDGELLVSFARERLEYIYPQLTPEGITGTPSRARIVGHDGVLGWVAQRAVAAVDDEPHGVFCVDLREDAEGQVRPTEINAGRFSTTVGLWSIYSERSNFVALAAELALDNDVRARWRLQEWEDLPEGLTLSRHIDCGHVFSEAKVPA